MLLRCVLSLIVCASSLHLFVGCKGEERSGNQILAKIGSQTITIDEFNRKFDRVRLEDMSFDIKDETSLSRLKADFLNRLIERKILSQEVRRRRVKITEDELDAEISLIRKDYPGKSFSEILIGEYVRYEDWKERIRVNLLTEKLVNEIVTSNISIGDKELEEYYQKHSQDFILPEQVKARQIVVGTEMDAREVLLRLKNGEDFMRLAKEKSLSPDGGRGGDMGYFSRGQMPPEFDEVVFSLEAEQLSKIVRSPYGFHVFKVEEKRKAKNLSFLEACDRIRERLRKQRAEEVYDDWFKKKLEMAEIEVNHRLLWGGQ